ncbi:MAG: response regulator [Acidobacteriota bacterium]|nr:MAG: response regulator [Acidobacteriota bacterium]
MSGWQHDLEIPCTACGKLIRLREDLVPADGELTCPECGDLIAFRSAPSSPAARATSPPAVTPVEGRGAGSSSRSAAAPSEPRPSDAPTPNRAHQTLIRIEEWEDEEVTGDGSVTCPACGHRFDAAMGDEARRTILVVEDTDFFLRLATDVLGSRYGTLGVRTAAEACEVLATRPVDLVVLDLTLPDAEGTEVLRALPRPDIPVLLYTSRDETSLLGPEWETLKALGADDVVHKGINIEDTLMTKVGELLERRPARVS